MGLYSVSKIVQNVTGPLIYIYWKLPQICNVILRIFSGKLRDLQYIYAVTSGSPSTRNLACKLNACNHEYQIIKCIKRIAIKTKFANKQNKNCMR